MTARWLGWLITICLLNSIIDSPVRYISYGNVDKSSYNEIESIAEWMLEEVANIDNAVPEDDQQDEELIQKEVKDWQFEYPLKISVRPHSNGCLQNGIYSASLLSPVSDRIFPPPELKS